MSRVLINGELYHYIGELLCLRAYVFTLKPEKI